MGHAHPKAVAPWSTARRRKHHPRFDADADADAVARLTAAGLLPPSVPLSRLCP